MIYADFEALTGKVNDSEPQSQNTTRYQRHEPSGFCYKFVSSNTHYKKPAVAYRGHQVISKFLHCILDEAKGIREELKKAELMQLNENDEIAFQMATTCHICHKRFGDSLKVRDHDHLKMGFNYRGAAHINCNPQYKFKKTPDQNWAQDDFYIPVIFHNLRGYDSHLIKKE